MQTQTFLQRMWRWLIAPSQEINEPDQRRQATLLSALLLMLIIGGALVEVITIFTTDQPHYTGYWDTLIALSPIAVVYAISRTGRIRLASVLAISLVVAAIYFTGWAQSYGEQGVFLNYLILPLWLGSLYLSFWELVSLMLFELVSLLLVPVFVLKLTFNEILIGPFSFIFMMSILLIVLTRHRNLLELDRRRELTEKERRSRREASRAAALLRVAERLNAQLDLDALLTAISEEVTRALNTPISLIALYDPKEKAFYSRTAQGIAPDLIQSMSPFPRAFYDSTIKELGTIFALPDLQAFSQLPNLDLFKSLELCSLAFATMKYEQELIGSLSAFSAGERRNFTEDELLLLHGLADQAALAINNTRLYKEARRRLEHLQSLRLIDIAIASNHNLQDILNVLLEQITKQLEVDAAAILLFDEASLQLNFGMSLGFQTSTLRYTSLQLGEGMAGRAALERRTVHVPDLRSDPQSLVKAPALAKEGFVSYYASPLISQGHIKGVVEIFQRSMLNPEDEWLGFLETLAGQAAIAIENTALFEGLQRTNAELVKAYDATIEGWSHALDLRDKETEGHTQRVTELTLELARAFGYSDRQMIYIRWGGLLHDIGKMGIPDRILLKEGPLTEDEWIIMRQHPVYAHEMLRTIQYLRPALDIPYCHHEKWDGTGYPRKLKADEIPLLARIFAVVDVWDALTSDRPYRPAWSREKALAYVRENAGLHFDPHVVEKFTALIR